MTELLTITLCLGTGGVSYLAFENDSLKERLLFEPKRILTQKEWYRLLSSALIHADWMHLGFNLLSLYMFGRMIELYFGAGYLFLIYWGSVFGGDVLSLLLHRNHDYRSLGASGGVCGVIFAVIFLAPGTGVGMFPLPITIPGPIYALFFLGCTFYALRKKIGNTAHDAHFGGAISGLLLALCIAPANCLASPILFSSLLVLVVVCLLVLARDPLGISGKVFPIGQSQYRSDIRHQEYDEVKERKKEEGEIDRILEKIAATGIHSITAKERAKLENASKKTRRS